MLSRQMLYCLSHVSSSFLFYFLFEMGTNFDRTRLGLSILPLCLLNKIEITVLGLQSYTTTPGSCLFLYICLYIICVCLGVGIAQLRNFNRNLNGQQSLNTHSLAFDRKSSKVTKSRFECNDPNF